MSQRRGLLMLLGALFLVCSPVGGAEPSPPRTDRHGDPLPAGALVRLGCARLRVDEEVKALAFWPDDQTVAACCTDGSVRLWERGSGREKRRLETGLASVHRSAFVPGASTLVLVRPGQVVLWDGVAGKMVWTTELSGQEWPSCLAISDDGSLLALASEPRKVSLYEASSGRKLRELQGIAENVQALAFSPDGRLLAVAQGERPAGLWDVRTGKKVRDLPSGPSTPFLLAVAFARDGQTVAVAASNKVVLSAVATGKELTRITIAHENARLLDGAISPGGLLFSADGKTLITAHFRGALRFWDARTGNECQPRKTYRDELACLALSADGKALAVGNHKNHGLVLQLLNPATGADLLPIPEGHTFSPRFVAFTPDGRSVVSADKETVRFWEAATGRPGYRGQESFHSCLALPAEPPEDLFQLDFMALTPDRRLLATVLFDEVRLWDLSRGKELPGLKYRGEDAIRAVAITPDGKQLLTVHSRSSRWLFGDKSEGQDGLRVWDVATGKQTKSFLAPTPNDELFAGLIVTSDGSTAIAGSIFGFLVKGKGGYGGWGTGLAGGGRLYQWNLRAGMRVRTLEGHRGGILALGLSADDRLLVSVGGDKTCRLWELASGQTIFRRASPESFKQAVAISPDGRLIAASSGQEEPSTVEPFLIRVYSTVTGERVLSLRGHTSSVRCLTFSPDGRRLASGFRDGTALIWDLSAAQQAVEREIQHLAPRQADTLWASLADSDVVTARQALWCLVGKGEAGMRLLKEHQKPAEGVEPGRLRKLVEELDGDDFAAREAAGRELLQLGELAEPALLAAQKDRPSLELQRRVAQLLARIAARELSPSQLRAVRAVEVLERIGSPAARQLLGRLAAGAAGTRLTREARAALDRLGQRGAP